MRTTIDKAGRIVVPKALRDAMGLEAGQEVELTLTDGRIEIALEGNTEAYLFYSGTVVSKVQTLIQERIDVRRPVFAGAFARMQQHVLDDGVGALAVLDDLFEIVLQQAGQFVDFFADLTVHRDRLERVIQLIGKLGR